MISVVIPAKDEKYLQKTIDICFERARGTIEVVVVLDGYWPNPPLKDHNGLVVIHHGDTRGMRAAINSGVLASKYDYILKLDGHCSIAKGFDKQLIEDCKEWNWVLVPTRHKLCTQKWDKKGKKVYEFQYISSDDLKGRNWEEYGARVVGQQICDLMTTQGSCWFMTRKMWDHIGGEDEGNYGFMGREAQEICLKTWLSGGRFALTRNTWYAHWSKGRKDVIRIDKKQKQKSVDFAKDIWLNDKWDKAVKPLSWLIDKFSPVPTWNSMTPKRHIIEKYKLNGSSPCKLEKVYRKELYELFSDLGYKVGAEIGVQRGRNAMVMFETIPDLKLYLIEPYKNHPNANVQWRDHVHEKVRKQAHKKIKGKYNAVWLEGFSEDVHMNVPNGSLDFVYIDGMHTYEFCMLDLIIWSRKVKIGGIVSGHDYNSNKPEYAVNKVLEHYAGHYDISPIFLTDRKKKKGDTTSSWFYVKEGDVI